MIYFTSHHCSGDVVEREADNIFDRIFLNSIKSHVSDAKTGYTEMFFQKVLIINCSDLVDFYFAAELSIPGHFYLLELCKRVELCNRVELCKRVELCEELNCVTDLNFVFRVELCKELNSVTDLNFVKELN